MPRAILAIGVVSGSRACLVSLSSFCGVVSDATAGSETNVVFDVCRFSGMASESLGAASSVVSSVLVDSQVESPSNVFSSSPVFLGSIVITDSIILTAFGDSGVSLISEGKTELISGLASTVRKSSGATS
eukprot:Gregarina_sp_Poly_1__10454@NODE_75_length_15886_cov_79_326569_g64_i0_p5_GENE_NODE_75_length_15886_cov_79_326569_g64_i0NODE_75_length_15886_cov_79_326569_g64_i0_p5_ORF_typecomplete_len130_score11_10_NODE_75_length_15886_cov_79_326569_g64_i031963585